MFFFIYIDTLDDVLIVWYIMNTIDQPYCRNMLVSSHINWWKSYYDCANKSR